MCMPSEVWYTQAILRNARHIKRNMLNHIRGRQNSGSLGVYKQLSGKKESSPAFF